jgi:ribonuclease HI
MKALAICDGRGNAGTGARACIIRYQIDGVDVADTQAEKIPATTNIVAEHLAIQLAMELAKDIGITHLTIWNDSQTPVNQVNGTYRVKQDHLVPIVERTWEMGLEFESVEIVWVPREKTKEPDALCRQIDREPAARSRPGGPVPQDPAKPNPFLKKA